jgi:hypothetical protein
MQLLNLTSGAVLADQIEVASSFRQRLKGLIGRPCLNSGEALILLPCQSIHTCFMRFPIDVVFVDREGVVLRTLEMMKPYRFSPVIAHSHLVVELPGGRLADTGTMTGDHLQLLIKEEAS